MLPILGEDMQSPPVTADQTLEGLNDNQPSTGEMGDLETREGEEVPTIRNNHGT